MLFFSNIKRFLVQLKNTYVLIQLLPKCKYPDPDNCPNYDDNTGLCLNNKTKCSYRESNKNKTNQEE